MNHASCDESAETALEWNEAEVTLTPSKPDKDHNEASAGQLAQKSSRYFFNITDGHQTLLDNNGVELGSVVAARERATKHGRLIVENLRAVVNVTTSTGATVMMAQLSLEDIAQHAMDRDPLTGLLGRTAFLAHLSHRIETDDSGTSFGLLLIDVDRLKETNDVLGYAAGDAVLKYVAATLREMASGIEFHLARLDGDKFALILPEVVKAADAILLAESVKVRLQAPVHYASEPVTHSVSTGLAIFPGHGSTSLGLMSSADIALHLAKSVGGGTLVVYAKAMRADRVRHFAALAEARSTLMQSRILPHYQPLISLRTGLVLGFEALLRIRRPSGEVQAPAVIADALDHPDLSVSIGQEMQTRVIRDLARWKAAGIDFGKVAINASPVELLLSSYAQDLLGRLRAQGIPPHLVQVEVTETTMSGQGSSKIIGELRKLRESGVGVFLDDFGTGYGSLIHLREYPIDGIKIDRSFVADSSNETATRTIVSAIIQLAKNLEFSLVAEGVETTEQADFLRTEGCDVVQGYLFAHAMDAEAVPAYLKARREGSIRAVEMEH